MTNAGTPDCPKCGACQNSGPCGHPDCARVLFLGGPPPARVETAAGHGFISAEMDLYLNQEDDYIQALRRVMGPE